MSKVKIIGRWKYFAILYYFILILLIFFFMPQVPLTFMWCLVFFSLILSVIAMRNPIIKVEDEIITLAYLSQEKNISKKDIVKIESISGFFFAYYLVTKNDKFFLLLNPFMIGINSWISTHSYSEDLTSILKGDENS